MISKWKMEMLAFLTSLTLVSVGFSSWQITGPVVENTTGTIQSEPVIKTDNYVKLRILDEYGKIAVDENGVADTTKSVMQYNEGGFIIKDENVDGGYISSLTGHITLSFVFCNLSTSPFKNNEDKYLQISCDIALKNNSSAFFNLITNTGYEYTPPFDRSNLISIPEREATDIGYKILLPNIPIELLEENSTYTYKLKLTINEDYRNKLGNYLANNEFVFNTQVYGTKGTTQ